MDLINELVHNERLDAVRISTNRYTVRAGAARAAIERRIEAIEDAAIQIGVDGETIGALLDGTE